ncbi:CHC2 zinc finger domain-containing protein [Thalassobellus citreus]|uniref:CHC2 zinc finger domain-containing protein n=1 Tax=Thalassobellus citreus TaxID=3367752 RepID=UPI0037B31A9B
MPYISKEKKEAILEAVSLEQVLESYHDLSKKKGSQVVVDCPICKTKEKLEFNKAKGVAKCFKCDIGVKTAASYLTSFHGKSYPDALEELARLGGIDLNEKRPNNTDRRSTKTYCDKMLKDSGLKKEDVTDERIVIDEETVKEFCLYQPGTVDQAFEIVKGDDVIIHYFDLDGNPMYYYTLNKSQKAVGKKKPFYRVRFQNPELHRDKNDKPTKYRSPYGSGSKIYINKYIREKYHNGSRIETLYIQEGEKKADKASKHGMPSVGIMGIHNIAYNKRLPVEFELIIQRCQVEKVVFIVDADWLDLSHKIDSKHSADNRPRSFFTAIKNFRNHFASFANQDIHLKIFWGYVKENPEKDKGVDDLLANSLKSKPDTLADLCKKALNTPEGDASYLQFEEITTTSDYKLLEHWGLQNIDAFVSKHKEALSNLELFKFGSTKWRIDPKDPKGYVLAQPLLDHERFWTRQDKKNNDGDVIKSTYTFNNKRCYNFLQARGYNLLEQPDNTYIWIQTDGNIVREVKTHQIRNFIIDFTKKAIANEDVENMLYRGSTRYFGPDSLSHLEYTKLELLESKKGLEYMFFNESFWKITAEGIEESDIKNVTGQVWETRLKDFSPKKTPLLLSEIHQITHQDAKESPDLKEYIGEWTIDFSEEGEKCDYLQFLYNTSNFYPKKEGKKSVYQDLTLPQAFETSKHLLSKITAIGYLLHNFKDDSVLKAVVAMDGTMTEVGSSNGRSGKSLVGKALKHALPQVFVNGKNKNFMEDKYKWEEVNERIQNVFIDDVRTNFDLEGIFTEITGDWQVEGKGDKKFTIPHHLSPKIYITTNHALRGEGGSFRDRQFLLGFSNWYNDEYQPTDDFKALFWSEWDTEQWNLFYNFLAMCSHLYFKYGLITAPTEKLEKRKLRQDIGEVFIDWADEYFSRSQNLNCDVPKSRMFNEESIENGKGFLVKYPAQSKYINVRTFKNKIKKYCELNEHFEYNAIKKGADIKRDGTEYISLTVSDELYAKLANTF